MNSTAITKDRARCGVASRRLTTESTALAVGTVGELVERLGPAPIVLLAVWSHPDDESFLAGGLLAEVARRGGRVVNVTATSGEGGTDDPVAHPPAALAERRERELGQALDELGAEPAIGLGFGDGSCDLVPERLGAGLVGAIVDQVDPDVIVSFGPDGVTGHPDHRAVGRWTRGAVADRDDRTPLLTTAAAAAWPAHCVERLHSIDAFWPGYPDRDAGGFDRIAELDEWLVERKLAALARHASQMAPVEQALGADGFRTVASFEAYRAANPMAHHRLSATFTPLAA